MAHWDCRAQRVIAWPTQPWPGRPGWLQVDCGCSAGLMWGGESPRECAHAVKTAGFWRCTKSHDGWRSGPVVPSAVRSPRVRRAKC